ncbi:MAG: hypothetical protein F4Z25_06615 [Chloroflexi bacterium]|nr:hypothetical protein [Chloroflexota bacterium]
MTTTAAPADRVQLLASIRGIGHWRVRIIPESAGQRFQLTSDCREAVERSAVQFRGWDYPHIPVTQSGFQCGEPVPGGWEARTDWDRHRELWRLTRSGQFIHYLALWEDIDPEFRDQRILGVSGAVYTLLEIVEFCRRLTGTADYGAAIDLEIDLANTMDRSLKMLDQTRMLEDRFGTDQDCVQLRRPLPLPLTGSAARTVARDLAIELFDTFGCSIGPRIIDGIQEEVSSRR